METVQFSGIAGQDIIVPLTLEVPVSNAAYVYDGDPNKTGLEMADVVVGLAAVSGYDLVPAGLHGLHLLTIPASSIPAQAKRMALVLYSPTGAFQPREIHVTLSAYSLDTAVAELVDQIATTTGDLDDALAVVAEKVHAILVRTRYSKQTTFVRTGSQITSIVTKFSANDANPNFNAPDSVMQTDYIRDGATGRVTGSQTKEVL